MAASTIQGDLIALQISTVLTAPLSTDLKEVTCAENSGIEGTRDVNTRRTKCGVFKGYGPPSHTFTFSGVVNATPATGQISANTLLGFFENETPLYIKMVHTGTSSLLTRTGLGQITRYSETENSGDLVSFEMTIEIDGALTIS
jgi:hypothetical protein